MKKVMMTLLLASYQMLVSAQVMIESDPLMENFPFQIKLVDEFMSRLNGDTSIDGSSRELDLASLFHKDVYMGAGKRYAEDFAHEVDEPAKYIDFKDSTWYAVAECAVEIRKGKEEKVTIVLKTENCGEFQYKWVMAHAYADCLDLTPDRCNPGLKIPPTDNEVNFMSLSAIEPKNVLNYTSRGFAPDRESVLFAMMYYGLMKIKYVDRLSYVFTDIAGYRLSVEYFPGESRNSGWLISDIRPLMKNVDSIPFDRIVL